MRIREAHPDDAPLVNEVQIASWRTTYAGIVPAPYLAGLSSRFKESWWRDILAADLPGSCCFVAETESGDIVGFAGGGPERQGNRRYRSELRYIYLLEEHHRRGLGRRLIAAVSWSFLRDGLSSMLTWVLEENSAACRFYESLGGDRIGWRSTVIGGKELVELCYAWTDVAPLAARATSTS